MPLPGRTRVLAMSSRFSSGLGSSMSSSSLSSFREESNLEFSTLIRASSRLSSTVLPRRKQPRMVAEAMENRDKWVCISARVTRRFSDRLLVERRLSEILMIISGGRGLRRGE